MDKCKDGDRYYILHRMQLNRTFQFYHISLSVMQRMIHIPCILKNRYVDEFDSCLQIRNGSQFWNSTKSVPFHATSILELHIL